MRTVYQFLAMIICSVLLSSCFSTWGRGYDYDEYGYYQNHFRGGDYYYYTTPPPPPPTYGMPMGTGGHFASPSRSKTYVVSGGNGRSVQQSSAGDSRNSGHVNNGYGNGRTNNTGAVSSAPSTGNSQQPSAPTRRSIGNFQAANARNSNSSTTAPSPTTTRPSSSTQSTSTSTSNSTSSNSSTNQSQRSHVGGGGMRR